ncbi:MAG TPA: Gldg family protein, partial [Thermodesulfobacteriota bacterium]|nr:Gldg family protein [Thermodesulfobacteriota bacterium]
MGSLSTSDKWKEGSFLTLLTVIFLAILAVVNMMGQRFPRRLDLTAGQRYSISSQSRKIVKSIKQPVWVRAFFQEGNPAKKKAQALLEIYASTNPLIHFQFIDPDRQPALAQQYGVRNYGALILQSAGKIQPV